MLSLPAFFQFITSNFPNAQVSRSPLSPLCSSRPGYVCPSSCGTRYLEILLNLVFNFQTQRGHFSHTGSGKFDMESASLPPFTRYCLDLGTLNRLAYMSSQHISDSYSLPWDPCTTSLWPCPLAQSFSAVRE